jgi:hypothetical protein
MKLVQRILILSLIILSSCHLGACSLLNLDKTTEPENTSTLTGIVEDISATTWTIDDKVVQVGDDVLIKGNIMIGDEVEALVTLGENATLQVIEIVFVARGTPEDMDEYEQVNNGDQAPVEFSGTVESIEPDHWIVSGKVVTITSQTDIKGNKHSGKTVLVQAYPQEDGSFLALQIKPVDSGETIGQPGDTFDFVGVVKSMVGDNWIIGSRVVLITRKSEIDPDIEVGDEVKVEGIFAEDGSLIALEIMPLGDR